VEMGDAKQNNVFLVYFGSYTTRLDNILVSTNHNRPKNYFSQELSVKSDTSSDFYCAAYDTVTSAYNMWLHKGRCMSADDKNLKLNF
jgi:hypothetical protein